MVLYKIDTLDKLKSNGYSSYRIRVDKIMGQNQLQDIRSRKVTVTTLNKLCELLNCQPGDILEYIPDTPNDNDCNTCNTD